MSDDQAQQQLGTVKRIYAHWGRHPRVYAAQDWFTFLGRPHVIRRRAVGATGMGPGARVLEVACGTGRNFRYIEDRIGPEGQLVGFDYTSEMLDAARELTRQRGWQNVALIQGDAAELEVGDEPFDAVVSILSMSVIPQHIRALERCREVLRPGGVLSICDARLLPGRLRALNPLIRAIFVPTTGWRPDRDLVTDIRRVFGNVSVESYNLGSFFVATATRDPE